LTSTINVNKAVKIYGGFAGTEVSCSQRDCGQNNVIIDGDNSYRCLTITADATIDGFVITNGYAVSGGGISCTASAKISNCIFFDNEATFNGGAVYNSSNYLKLINCVFAKNSQTLLNYDWYLSGGAIYSTSDNFYATNCTFYKNSAYKGGAIALRGSNGSNSRTAWLENCIIYDNLSSYGSNIWAFYGCAFYRSSYMNGGTLDGSQSYFIEDPRCSASTTASDAPYPEFNIDVTDSVTAANLKGADGKWMTSDDGLALKDSSPCRDIGTNNLVNGTYYVPYQNSINFSARTAEIIDLDIAMNNRKIDGNGDQVVIVDMGAYEYIP
jgi:hypothetical protein